LKLTESGLVSTQFGEHAAPVKALIWNKTLGAAITGSWDKTFAIFDPRDAKNSKMEGGKDVSERVHAMDNRDHLVAVATADRKVSLYDLRNVQTKIYDTPLLDKQSTAIIIFPDKKAFALSSIEGREAIQYYEGQSPSFKFKCHRVDEYDAYAVNVMATAPNGGEVFATAGSDGTFAFWNKEIKKRLFHSKRMLQPITAAAFNHNGNILAYATGYDWSKGAEYADKAKPPQILLHGIDPSQIKPPI